MARSIKLEGNEEKLRQLLLKVSKHVNKDSGPQLRFTGGWVRDKLLGAESKDIDIGIESMTGSSFTNSMKEYLEQLGADDETSKSVLGKLATIQANPEKSKHLETVTTKIFGFDVDFVNLRKETYTEESRNPQMVSGTPTEDALRRDATINALFYNLHTSEVEDLTGRGLEDMKRRIIKTPLDPYQTFMDDPLRVLRAIRFASRLGWEIDVGDERAMSDQKIHEAFKHKITRERVGIELTKMLEGPHPHQALRLIDRLGLYHTVFSMLNDEISQSARTENWKQAYEELHVFSGADLELTSEPHTESMKQRLQSLKITRSILLGTPTEHAANAYSAWLLCAFVPWARVPPIVPQQPKARVSLRPAALVARDGIKADNNTVKLVDNAVRDLDDIIQLKDAANVNGPSTTSPLKRKHESPTRSEQGMAIRRWGPQWRNSVTFTMLTQIMESPEKNQNEVLASYAKWLTHLQDLDVLEANDLKPLVTGDMLSKAFPDVKRGPWMSEALKICMAWQLANPDERDPEAAILEVKGRKRELGLA